jgi:hypothetical protein
MQTELKTFKRVSQSKVILDGIIWETNQDKSIRIRSAETGYLQHSIVVDGIYYYPVGVKGKNLGTYELETISE